jgi:L-rhamnose isomerase
MTITMKSEQITKAYELAKARYADLGINTENVINQLQDFHLSMHCWQADDVAGFEVQAGALSGGIQSTGNYPGKARNIDELRADVLKAKSLIPGNHRLNLHEIYGDFKGKVVDRDEVDITYFQSWIDWGKEYNTKLDFNSTSFSHPKSGNLSLSNPDDSIRNFWIEHTKRCRDIANAIGEAQGDPCIMNLWVHDGCKDQSVNHFLYRHYLKDSLDQIFAKPQPMMKDCIEGKVFGIGLESFTVGSHDFYTAYAAKNNIILTIDTGHYHPTESPADKVSAVLQFVPELMLHVSRPVRWDSDHVTIMDDPTQELFSEIVRANAMDRVHYGLDFFDGSINRIGAYVIGSRAAQKCMTRALLEPTAQLSRYELEGKGFQVLGLLEEAKALPWNAVYDEFCQRNDVPVGADFIAEIEQYEKDVTSKR